MFHVDWFQWVKLDGMFAFLLCRSWHPLGAPPCKAIVASTSQFLPAPVVVLGLSSDSSPGSSVCWLLLPTGRGIAAYSHVSSRYKNQSLNVAMCAFGNICNLLV